MRSDEMKIPNPEFIENDVDMGGRLYAYSKALSRTTGNAKPLVNPNGGANRNAGLKAELEKTLLVTGGNV